MKISKLVATAIIGAVAITPASADLNGDRTAYTNAKKKYDDRVAASKVLYDALKVFTEVGADALKAYDPSGNKETDRKIKAAVESVENIGKTGGGTEDGIKRTNLEKLTIGEDKKGSIHIEVTFESTTTNPNKIELKINNGSKSEIKSTEKTNYADLFNIATDFAWDTAWATLKAASDAVAIGAEGLLSTAKTDLDSKEVAYAKALTEEKTLSNITVPDDIVAFNDNRADIVEALKNDIATKASAYKTAQETEAHQKEIKAAVEAAAALVRDDASASKQNTQDAIKKANDLLKKYKLTINNVNNSSKNANGDSAKLDATDLASSNDRLATALSSFVVAASDVALNTAKTLLEGFNELTSSNMLTLKAKENLATAVKNVETTKKGYDDKIKVETQIKVSQAILNEKDPAKAKEAIEALKAAVTKLNTDSATTKSQGDDKKKEWLKQAVASGLVFSGDITSSLNGKVTTENIDSAESGKLNGLIDAAVAVITDTIDSSAGKFFKDATDELAKWASALSSENSQKELLKDSRVGRLEATGDVLGGGSKGAIANDIAKRLDTQIGEKMADATSKDLREAISSIDDSLSDVASQISQGVVLDSVKFAQDQAVTTRLAVLANPYGADIALAKAINAAANDKFADAGDAVNDVIKAYTDRFKNDNNLWGNIVGGKAMIKDAPNTDLYGVNIGYDKAFDNFILGAYLGYANSNASSSNITHKSDIYSIGTYARAYFDNNEIDTQVSFGVARNKLDRSTSGALATSQSAKFNSFMLNLSTTYGYIFNISEGVFLKPFAGIEYNYLKNDSFTENGTYAFKFSSAKSKNLYGKLGVELRKYVDNANYFYVAPSIGHDLYKSKDSLIANSTIKKEVNESKKTYFGLNTGLDLAITQNLSGNINFALKAANKEQFYNGNLGLRYKF